MDQRRGQPPFSGEWFPPRNQPGYSPYYPVNDEPYAQDYREYGRASDTDGSFYYDENYYHDDYVGYTSTSYDQYSPYPNEYTGRSWYRPHPHENTSQDGYKPHPDDYTGSNRPQYHPVVYESQNLYETHHGDYASNKGYQPHSDVYTSQNRNQSKCVKGYSKPSYNKVQSCPKSQSSATKSKQIPSLIGRGSNSSPSKKWNGPKRSSGSSNKIIQNTSIKSQEKQAIKEPMKCLVPSEEIMRSNAAAGEIKKLQKNDCSRQTGSAKSQNLIEQTDIGNLASNEIPIVKLRTKPQAISSECILSKPPSSKCSEIMPPCHPGDKFCQKQILPMTKVDPSNNITCVIPDHHLMKEENLDSLTDNVDCKIKECLTSSEIELVNKFQNIELGFTVKGKDNKQEILSDEQNIARNVILDDKKKSIDDAESEKDKKDKSDNDIKMDISCSGKDFLCTTKEIDVERKGSATLIEFGSSVEENMTKEKGEGIKHDKCCLSSKFDDNFDTNPTNRNGDDRSKVGYKVNQNNAYSGENESEVNSFKQSEPEFKVRDNLMRDKEDSDNKKLQGTNSLDAKGADERSKIQVQKHKNCKNEKVSDLHKRVLGKLSIKTSLVMEVNNRSLELLKKKKDLDTSGSSVKLCYMDVDDNSDILTDTGTTFDLGSDNDSVSIFTDNIEDMRSKNNELQKDESQLQPDEIENRFASASTCLENSTDMLETPNEQEEDENDEEFIKLQDLELKQKFNIREAYVSLDKVDCLRDKDDVGVKPSEQSGEPMEPESKVSQDKTDHSRQETESDAEDKSVIRSNDDLCHLAPEDTQNIEVDNVTSSDIHSLPDLNKCENEEKYSEASNESGSKNHIPLSYRFGQLINRPEETVDIEETEFKAEFENIVNRLKTADRKSRPQEVVTSNIEQNNEMEVDEQADGNEVKVSGMASEDDNEQLNCNDDRDIAGHSNNGNVKESTSNKGANEEVDVSKVKKDEKNISSSPVSFLDYSDDSDDELLVTPSAFLRSIEEINGRPLVITPTKVIDSSQNSNATTSSNDLSPLKPVPHKPGLKNKFTLDGLLADHEERADLVKQMNEIDEELQNEIKQGGFVNILNKEDSANADSPITDEQKEMLKQFEVEESRICEDRPGVVVFETQNYQCLFTSNIRPVDCGFKVGSNGLSLEKHLESLTPAQYKRVITCGIISQCFTKITCQTQIMRWLFFIMSVHEDHQVQHGCKKILLEILHYQHNDGQQKWAPRLVDVLSVLHNYGASLESLIPCNSSTLEIIRGKMTQETGHVHQPVAGDVGMKKENLILVLQILAQCLHGPSGRYSASDLTLLCVALCKASLDTSLKHLYAKGAFENCITMVIRQYLEPDWLKERLKLTRMLVAITDHHHNNAHIAELLPPGARGMFIQRRFCYLVLSELILDKTNVSDELLNSIKIKDLEKFIPRLKDVLEEDSYKLSSIVTLIDLCVGVHLTMSSEEREQLKSLLEKVRYVRVRDNVSMLDRTRIKGYFTEKLEIKVKDMIVRMTSKWALDIQTMKGKQTKIFEYASPVKMYVEQVQVLQSSGDDDDHSDSDNDLPFKIQKLSPQIHT